MKILVSGGDQFNDYNTFICGVGVAIDELLPRDDDGNIVKESGVTVEIYTAGPVRVNDFTAQFCNMSERTMRAMGVKIKFFRYPYRKCVSSLKTWEIDKVLLFGIRNIYAEPLAVSARISGVDVSEF